MQQAGYNETAVQAALRSWGVSRHIYVAPTDKEAIREAEAAELWYQKSLARFLVPENIEAAAPSLQPQFRALAAKLATITWEDLLEETVLFGSPERIVDRVREMEEAGVGELLCWMNFGGLPQEEIFFNEGMVRINGSVLLEDYLPENAKDLNLDGARETPRIWITDPGEYFVMGDRRHDSQYFGPVSECLFLGRVWLRYWPIHSWSIISGDQKI